MLKELVKERLMAAADEIFVLFERAIASYEEDISRTREEKERRRRQLEAVSKSQTVRQTKDVQQLISHQEEHTPHLWGTLEQGPRPSHIKEEEDELWMTRRD
ncbi:uncharacterized protein [Nerophis lumbriciformis]|uniref:uncharacterized protein isoform X3 n=1 Tax=Nerophis lumbriciformis TaxID=546530 RepID=UPI002AE07FFA|nr:uncharacterized protein LOC133575248 isoform X2 [Nerophis lumbriciformis]